MTFARVMLTVAACAGTALSAPAPPSEVKIELTPACDPSSNELRGRYRMRVAWGTARCPATVRGEWMSSFGRAAPADTVGELSSLRNAVYYWGSPQETKVDDSSLHLRSAWFGKPAFGVAVAGAWAGKLFAAERAFFNDDDPNPYSMFVRVLESHEDRANGMGQETSYLSWIGPRTPFARRLKVNIRVPGVDESKCRTW